MREYHARVGAYFDEDEPEFDRRYWSNPILQRIRQAFREEVRARPFETALEIGCGTGLDLAHFARVFPDRRFVGVDVSERMVSAARDRASGLGLGNVQVERASEAELGALDSPGEFDLGFVFFGALNTVEDLDDAADRIYSVLSPGGWLVLTFINRWYVLDVLIHLLRGRPRRAFARFREVWGGYSPHRELPSRCATPGLVRGAFGRGGRELKRRGFSILYPAWYRANRRPRGRRVRQLLWRADGLLNRTPAWCLGEYALYVFQKREQSPNEVEA